VIAIRGAFCSRAIVGYYECIIPANGVD